MGIASGIVASGGTTTTDATAKQWHIKSGKTAYIASGKVTGSGYFPAMMDFDGSSGYYSLSANLDLSAGWTVVGIGRWDGGPITSAGGFNRAIGFFNGTSYTKAGLTIVNDQTGDARAGRLSIFAQSTAGATLVNAAGTDIVSGGDKFSFLCAYDPSAGAAVIKIGSNTDQINASAPSHTLTTGTLETGLGAITVGARVVPDRYFDGNLGFLGIIGAYITDWTAFFRSDGSPIFQDPASWAGTGFGAQPLVFSPHGDMVNNLGSAGAMTKNGTINVGNGGT